MRAPKTAAVAVLAALLLGLGLAGIAGAGIVTPLTMTLAPTEGEVGTTVTVTPDNPCTGFEVLEGIDVYFDGQFMGQAPSTDGTWSFQFAVPDVTPGDYLVEAQCIDQFLVINDEGAGTNGVIASYEPEVFTVTAPPTTTSSSTTTTTTLPDPTITLSNTTPNQGDTVGVQATGYMPGAEVTITLQSDPIVVGTTIADEVGNVSSSFVVPADFPTGPHDVILTGTGVGGSLLTLTAGITVGAAVEDVIPTTTTTAVVTTVASGGGTLPRTGSSTLPLVLAGGFLLLGGAAFVAVSRRARASR